MRGNLVWGGGGGVEGAAMRALFELQWASRGGGGGVGVK